MGSVIKFPDPDFYSDWKEWANGLIKIMQATDGQIIISLTSYTVATVPKVVKSGVLIYVTDEVGGATVAFSDGTNWRRVADRVVISA